MTGDEQDGETRARGELRLRCRPSGGRSQLFRLRAGALCGSRLLHSPFRSVAQNLYAGTRLKSAERRLKQRKLGAATRHTGWGHNSGPPPYPQYKCLAKKRQANSTTGTKSFAVEKLSGQRGRALVCI